MNINDGDEEYIEKKEQKIAHEEEDWDITKGNRNITEQELQILNKNNSLKLYEVYSQRLEKKRTNNSSRRRGMGY